MISLFGGKGEVKSSRVYRAASLRDAPVDLIVYYSGHGAPSTSGETKGKGYLLPIDADILSIESTGYAIDLLLANIETMKSAGIVGRCWLTIDACFSGQSGDGSLLVKNVSGLAIVPPSPRALRRTASSCSPPRERNSPPGTPRKSTACSPISCSRASRARRMPMATDR